MPRPNSVEMIAALEKRLAEVESRPYKLKSILRMLQVDAPGLWEAFTMNFCPSVMKDGKDLLPDCSVYEKRKCSGCWERNLK